MEERVIFAVDSTYTWLREPLLARLPDNSLCCVFFTGGSADGDIKNIVAAARSDDDGETWSYPEVLAARPDRSAWAPSVFSCKEKTYVFWFTSKDWERYRKVNHILSTGPDGRSFTEDRVLKEDWITELGVDVRRGTLLRDGRVLLPIAWMEPVGEFDPDTWQKSQVLDHRYGNFGHGGIAENNVYCVGVMEPNDDFTSFTPYGRVCKETPGGELPCQPMFENTIAQLSGRGRLAMLIRGDMSNRLWRSDSQDGGRTWSEPYVTDIPNPGSKPLIINLPDGRIVLFHNPNEKDYDDTSTGALHKYRTPLEMWVSEDDMQSWCLRKTLVAAPTLAQYPDGFFDTDSRSIYLVWENGRMIYFDRIRIDDL